MSSRVVIAGLGDTGVLVAIHLGPGFDIVGVSTKPCLVSGQELGTRLTAPEQWKQDYLMAFDRYERLDDVRRVQGRITGIDTDAREVAIMLPDGRAQTESYDVLVISSGVTNGFWRNDAMLDLTSIEDGIRSAADRIAEASRIAIIGAGATGVSVSANVKERYRDANVDLFFSQERPLPGYHPKVRARMETHLERIGVHLHPGHRAVVPEGFACDRFTTEPVEWSTGQPRFDADLTLWSVGRVRPNNAFIPTDMLDADGFVKTDEYLRVPGYSNVFAVGDIAATDPNRSSARNWGYRLVARNIRATVGGREASMRRYEAPPYRWGSILGVQNNGMRVFQPNGGSFRFPRWVVERLLSPLAVRKIIYKGIRRA